MPKTFKKCVLKVTNYKRGSRQNKIHLSTAVDTSSKLPAKKNGVCNSKNLNDYLFNSSLHGLKYVGDSSLSLGERFFWMCAFIGAIVFATYFITNLYTKYNLNPVIISLNPKPTLIKDLPFPAITICNMNQAKKLDAERILKEGTEVEKILLDDYCQMNSSSVDINTVSDNATKWDNVLKFMLQVNPTCQEMLRVCLWKQEEMDCSYLFNNVLTDEGLCCSFNALPRTLIFTNSSEIPSLQLTFPPEIDDWNPEKGYSANATLYTLPRRAQGPGTNLGLSVVLDAALSTYYCSSTTSVGFKILLHNPIETPKMGDFGFLVAPGVESRIVIVPKIFDATQSLRHIDVKKRLCYFAKERRLRFYRTYTQRNCNLECQTNQTLQLCGCIPFYLPERQNKKICDKKQEQCSKSIKALVQSSRGNGTSCNCLPGCFEVGFDHRATYGKLAQGFKMRERLRTNDSAAYFVENMAILHFFFQDSQFTRSTKSELYGFSEFLSNTGGLLGLFLGFGFLSVVEVAYHLSLRVFCRVIKSRNKNELLTKNHVNPTVIYPFVK